MPERGWVYEDNGMVVYRASSLGSCLRSLVAARTGESQAPFRSTIRAAMDVSSGLEEELLRRASLELNDGSIIWQQKEVELKIPGTSAQCESPGCLQPCYEDQRFCVTHGGNGVIIRGHIDGLHQQSDTVIEAKCLSTDNYDRYITGGLDGLGHLAEKYKMQAAVYGHATGRRVRFVVGEKVKSPFVTPNEGYRTDEDGEISEWRVGRVDVGPPVDPESLVPLADIHARIVTIEDYAARDELPPCESGCRPGDPYAECHVFEALKSVDDEVLERLARFQEIKSILGSADKGTGLLGEKEDISEWLKENLGVGKFVGGPFTANIVHKKGSERVDTKRLKKERPDIVEEYKTFTAPTISLTVTGGERDE